MTISLENQLTKQKKSCEDILLGMDDWVSVKDLKNTLLKQSIHFPRLMRRKIWP